MENDTLLPLSQRGIEAPPELEQAIQKGLAVSAQERYQTMDEFLSALSPLRPAEEPVPPEPQPEPEPNPQPEPGPVPPVPPKPVDRRVLWGGAAAAAVLVLAVVLIAGGGKGKQEEGASDVRPLVSRFETQPGNSDGLDSAGEPAEKPAIGLTTGKTDGDSGKEASGQSEEASKEPSEPEPEETPEEEQPEEKPTDEPEEEPETEPETPSVKLPTPAAPHGAGKARAAGEARGTTETGHPRSRGAGAKARQEQG